MDDTVANDVVLSPMMKQFFELKAKHPDAIMLFRCGDFYETYSEDAIVASEILGITLTKRANGQAKSVEMAGFPFHALDTYLPKLVRAGKRVAICDQLEDPKMTKKLVKRGITELVTPGVAINDNVLSYKENNFLAAVHFGKASCGVAFLDISTGEFLTAEGPFDYIDKLLNNFAPKEVLFERGKRGMFEGNFGSKATSPMLSPARYMPRQCANPWFHSVSFISRPSGLNQRMFFSPLRVPCGLKKLRQRKIGCCLRIPTIRLAKESNSRSSGVKSQSTQLISLS